MPQKLEAKLDVTDAASATLRSLLDVLEETTPKTWFERLCARLRRLSPSVRRDERLAARLRSAISALSARNAATNGKLDDFRKEWEGFLALLSVCPDCGSVMRKDSKSVRSAIAKLPDGESTTVYLCKWDLARRDSTLVRARGRRRRR